MASKDDSDYELLTEHLGYPPVSLLDDIINTVNVLADRAVDSVEQLLTSIPPSKLGFSKNTSSSSTDNNSNQDALTPEDTARREIESGTHKLETLLTASIDRNFDKLELYAMQNILTVQPRSVRPYMRLGHYQGLDFTDNGNNESSSSSDRPSVESITALRRKVQASQRLNLALQKEKSRNDALLASLREVLGSDSSGLNIKREDPPTGSSSGGSGTFGFLHDKPALASVGSQMPISTTTEFTLSQLTALRSLSESLRDLLPNLATPLTASASDSPSGRAFSNPSWRKERSEYVEQSSRKYLERMAGLELGTQGEVRDGEYQGEGRNLGRSEVEGLEKVVTILGAQRRDRRPDRGTEADEGEAEGGRDGRGRDDEDDSMDED